MQLHGPMSGMLVTHSIALRSSEASECYLYWLASVGKSRHTFLHQNPLRCTGRGLEGRCHRALCCSQANGKLDSGQRKRQFLKYISEASSCLLFSDTPQRIQRSLEGRFKRASATCRAWNVLGVPLSTLHQTCFCKILQLTVPPRPSARGSGQKPGKVLDSFLSLAPPSVYPQSLLLLVPSNARLFMAISVVISLLQHSPILFPNLTCDPSPIPSLQNSQE